MVLSFCFIRDSKQQRRDSSMELNGALAHLKNPSSRSTGAGNLAVSLMAYNNKGFVEVIEISSSSSDDDDDSDDDGGHRFYELSPSSVKVKTEDEQRIEDDDCCILDYDPFETAAADLEKKLSLASVADQDDDLSIVAEKGEVACRDFPHSRHLCAEYRFDKTPHESYCPKCYCYVCDTLAPCTSWKGSLHSHCHASDRQLIWKDLRQAHKNAPNLKAKLFQPQPLPPPPPP